jgi:putative peptidoglycan lipid II flippase
MKLGLSLGALTGLQLLASLGLQVVVLRTVGAGAQTDGFVIAQTLPLLVVAVLATPMQNLWVSRLSGTSTDTSQWQAAHALAQGQMLWLMLGATLPLAATAPVWLVWLAPGLDPHARVMAVDMTRILLLGALCNGHNLLLTAALRSRQQFMLPEAVGASLALLALAAVFWVAPAAGVMGAAWLLAARSALASLILYTAADRPAFQLRVFRGQASWQQLWPLLAGTSVYKLSPLVDRYWGSMAPAGGLTMLSLAQTGMGAIAQVLERAVSVPVVPRLTPLAAQGRHRELWLLVRTNLIRVALITVTLALLLLAVSPWWDAILAQVLRLQPDAARQMWWICFLLIGFMHAAASGGLPVAAFVALGDTRTPMRVAGISAVVGMVLKSVGFLLGGLPGLTLATSIFYFATFVIVTHLLRKRLHEAAA